MSGTLLLACYLREAGEKLGEKLVVGEKPGKAGEKLVDGEPGLFSLF